VSRAIRSGSSPLGTASVRALHPRAAELKAEPERGQLTLAASQKPRDPQERPFGEQAGSSAPTDPVA
jgi:hypothetical protein